MITEQKGKRNWATGKVWRVIIHNGKQSTLPESVGKVGLHNTLCSSIKERGALIIIPVHRTTLHSKILHYQGMFYMISLFNSLFLMVSLALRSLPLSVYNSLIIMTLGRVCCIIRVAVVTSQRTRKSTYAEEGIKHSNLVYRAALCEFCVLWIKTSCVEEKFMGDERKKVCKKAYILYIYANMHIQAPFFIWF